MTTCRNYVRGRSGPTASPPAEAGVDHAAGSTRRSRGGAPVGGLGPCRPGASSASSRPRPAAHPRPGRPRGRTATSAAAGTPARLPVSGSAATPASPSFAGPGSQLRTGRCRGRPRSAHGGTGSAGRAGKTTGHTTQPTITEHVNGRSVTFVHSCAQNLPPGQVACYAERRTDVAATGTEPATEAGSAGAGPGVSTAVTPSGALIRRAAARPGSPAAPGGLRTAVGHRRQRPDGLHRRRVRRSQRRVRPRGLPLDVRLAGRARAPTSASAS